MAEATQQGTGRAGANAERLRLPAVPPRCAEAAPTSPALDLSVSLHVAKTEAACPAGGEGAARARRREAQGTPGCSEGNGEKAAGSARPTAKRAQARLVNSLRALERHLGARETL